MLVETYLMEFSRSNMKQYETTKEVGGHWWIARIALGCPWCLRSADCVGTGTDWLAIHGTDTLKKSLTSKLDVTSLNGIYIYIDKIITPDII